MKIHRLDKKKLYFNRNDCNDTARKNAIEVSVTIVKDTSIGEQVKSKSYD